MCGEFIGKPVAKRIDFFERKLFVIPNWRYQLLMGFVRAIPSAWVRWGSVYFVKLYRKNKHGA